MILEPGISSAEPGPNRTGQDSGRRRAGEKATDRWCEMIPCLWDFPMEGATGLGQPIAPLPVKPIWRPRAGREAAGCGSLHSCVSRFQKPPEGAGR